MSEDSTPRAGASFGNRPVAEPMGEAGRAAMADAAARKIGELLDVLRVDHRRDHNTRDTPARVARMMVEELMRGRYTPPPRIARHGNAERGAHLIVVGPIAVRSTCACHLMPISGHAVIGILPAAGGRTVDPSEYDRVVDHFASRLQLQEELAEQIERFLIDAAAPRGLAVRISAEHLCRTHRGSRAPRASRTVDTVYSGLLADDPALRNAFLGECAIIERRLA